MVMHSAFDGSNDNAMIAVYGCPVGLRLKYSNGNYTNVTVWSGKTFSWYDDGSSQHYQCNSSGETYYYVAIG